MHAKIFKSMDSVTSQTIQVLDEEMLEASSSKTNNKMSNLWMKINTSYNSQTHGQGKLVLEVPFIDELYL